MNKFITRAQELGKKAAELRQAVQSLPSHAAEIRKAVTLTGGELKQMRADVHANIQGLRADSEDHLLRSMREINDRAAVFAEAGYNLYGMDLDLALNQRLAVHLDKAGESPLSRIKASMAKESSDTVRSVLAGIVKAEETAANVELSQIEYAGLIIHIGMVPMIRMCWRQTEAATPTLDQLQPPTSAAVSTASPVVGSVAAPVEERSSMFDLRPLPGGPPPTETKPSLSVSTEPAVLAPERPAVPAAMTSWSQDALERFKKMPSVSKYSR